MEYGLLYEIGTLYQSAGGAEQYRQIIKEVENLPGKEWKKIRMIHNHMYNPYRLLIEIYESQNNYKKLIEVWRRLGSYSRMILV
jgi:division protein CdvB (Snf7/Vps24/ESCRT-III family)